MAAPSSFAVDLPYTGETLYLTTDNQCAAKVIKNETASIKTYIQQAINEAKRLMNDIGPGKDISNKTAQVETTSRAVKTKCTALSDRLDNIRELAVKHAVTKVVCTAREACDKARYAATTACNILTAESSEKADYEETARKAYGNASALISETEEMLNHDLGLEYARNQEKNVLVVGGGVSGLMTAWILLDKGYRVTIIAKEWAETSEKPERITSQIAGALWEYPPGGCGLSEIEVPVLAYSKLDQYRKWAMQSYLFYEIMATSGQEAIASSETFGAKMKTLWQFFYHDKPGENTNAEIDLATKRANQNAIDHHKKYEEICKVSKELFKEKLQVTRYTIGQDLTGEAAASQASWRGALDRINHEAFGLKWGYSHKAPVIDTDKAMAFLMKLVQEKGAILETRELKGDLHLHERELMDDYQAHIIVNASGLGAQQLANDTQVFPVRGGVRRVKLEEAVGDPQNENQRTDKFLQDHAVLLPAQYDNNKQPSKTIFIVPRNKETLIVGSLIQRNNPDLDNLHEESPEVKAMWSRANSFIKGLRSDQPPDGRKFAKGLRPFSHSNVRVSADIRTNSCRVVHNYGHGGSGWTLGVGCAWSCVKLVEKILHEGKSGSVANTEVWGLNEY